MSDLAAEALAADAVYQRGFDHGRHRAAEDVVRFTEPFRGHTRDMLLKAARVALNGPSATLGAPSEPVQDQPRVWEHVALPLGGETRQGWRSRDTVSNGSVLVDSRDEAERWSNRPPDPFGPNHRRVVETCTVTTWPDGTQLIGAWSEVVNTDGD